MKYALITSGILLSLSFSVNAVESISIPSSFNPVGSGARALGMGGAFIAMADDATAASWNPSALIQLREPEFALVYSSSKLTEDLTFGTNPESNGENSVSNNELNYFAASYPCGEQICGKNMVFSVNYQRLYDLSRDWNLYFEEQETVDEYLFQQSGSLSAFGLAYAIQLQPGLSLGATLNFWQDNDWQRLNDSNESGQLGGSPFYSNTMLQEEFDFSGFNYNLGLLWQVFQDNEQKLTLGLVYKSSFDADVNKTLLFSIEQGNPTNPDSINLQTIGPLESTSQLTMPASFGLGLAYQWSDNLTFSADFYHTQWSDFIFTEEDGRQYSPISGLPEDETDIENTTQIRMGVEYRIISQEMGDNFIIPLRFGMFLDPAAADGDAEDIYGISLGGGISFDNWVFDMAYQYRWADDIGKTVMPAFEFSQSLTEHQLYGSVFYRF